jgi:hypothetical protein
MTMTARMITVEVDIASSSVWRRNRFHHRDQRYSREYRDGTRAPRELVRGRLQWRAKCAASG